MIKCRKGKRDTMGKRYMQGERGINKKRERHMQVKGN
jgi:hypothetical protein